MTDESRKEHGIKALAWKTDPAKMKIRNAKHSETMKGRSKLTHASIVAQVETRAQNHATKMHKWEQLVLAQLNTGKSRAEIVLILAPIMSRASVYRLVRKQNEIAARIHNTTSS